MTTWQIAIDAGKGAIDPAGTRYEFALADAADYKDAIGQAHAHAINHIDDALAGLTFTAFRSPDALDGGCAWFALCDNAATGTTSHPILGDVPTCPRCADFASGADREAPHALNTPGGAR